MRSNPKPTPQSVPQKENAIEGTIRKIRTYKDDIAEAIRSQKTSLTSAVAAEQRKRSGLIPQDIHKKKSGVHIKKIAITIGSILFFAAGASIVAYFALFYKEEKVTIQQEIPSFFFTEEQKEIDITRKNAREILQLLGTLKNNISLPLGQIVHLYPTKTTRELDAVVTRIVPTREFLNDIRAQVSDATLRSLDTSFMIGVHVFNKNQPFMVFTSNSYQHSFAGLLEWERTMYSDLFLFMGRKTDPILGVLIDPQTGKELIVNENFEDKIIQNIDVRALTNNTGAIEFLYAFPNQRTLIITTNPNTLTEIITRINSVRVF